MDVWLSMLADIAADPVAAVALVFATAMLIDMMIIGLPSAEELMLTPEERREARAARKAQKASGGDTAADRLRGLDLRLLAQAVEDMIIDRQHLTRILGTRALDLWIDLSIEERSEGPTLKTRAKIVAFEPVPLDEARIAQSARMIKRRVAEELTQVLGVEDANGFVTGGVVIETAIERTA
jgi:hypothetical protein